jgi:hypothetical protein
MMAISEMKDAINEVFNLLKDKSIYPKGYFDKAGRFYLHDSDLVNVREPSLKYPYTQLNAGRTKKFVTKIVEKYDCKTVIDILTHFRNA